jgi:NifU-like protein involved in Fe-S cluster formation
MHYNELTLAYFKSARDAGELNGAGVFRGAAGSRARGTWVQFDLAVSAAVIRAARFRAFGCPHTIAVSAWLAAHAPGFALRAALPESVAELSVRFALPAEKRGRLLIIEDAWLAAITGAVPQSS